MTEEIKAVEDLDHDTTAQLVIDFFQRMMIHYALWFTEVRHQMGLPQALEILEEASSKSIGLQIKRLSKKLGFEMKNGLPEPLVSLPKEDLVDLVDAMAANWLTNDGVWFQAVEFSSGPRNPAAEPARIPGSGAQPAASGGRYRRDRGRDLYRHRSLGHRSAVHFAPGLFLPGGQV